MTTNTSRSVTTNQQGAHEDLLSVLVKHLGSDFQKPVAQHSREAFEQCVKLMATQERAIILDSGCGVGQSTRILAEQHPDCWVIGVDQSEHRLSKQTHTTPDNCILVRADLVDFWRLALDDRWHLQAHYLLYPNPWPKAKHLLRRWHAHPVFPTLINLGGKLTLRTNWDLYALEFAIVLDYLGYPTADIKTITPEKFLTPFEKKYFESDQTLYEVIAELA